MQRWDTVRALGNPVIRTPNLDRLASEGVAFSNAFSPSPVCIAARAAMIYGQYPYNNGCYENTIMPTDGRTSFMGALTQAGYRTHGIGKCHFTPERYALRGLQSREVQEEGGVKADDLERNQYLLYLKEHGYDHVMEPYGVRSEMYYTPQVAQMPAADHHSQWIGDRAISYIERRDDAAPPAPPAPDADGRVVAGPPSPDQPWYLFASFIHPHPPFAPPVPWHKIYRAAEMPMPNVPPDSESMLTLINRIQNRYKYQDQGVNQHFVRSIIAYYYACVSFVDFQVGRMLAALEATGQLDNTLILYASDHGEFLGDYGCYGKRSMHDPSSRVPLIARLPGRFEGGTVVEQAVSLVDIAPTFLSAAETRVDTHELDGVDLADVVSGRCDREFVFSQLSIDRTPFHRSVAVDTDTSGRTYSDDEWRARFSSYMAVSETAKYVYSAADDREFYIDRVRDPYETRNRAGVKFCARAKEHAKRALLAELIANGETVGILGANDPASADWRRFPNLVVNPDPDFGLLVQDSYTPWTDVELPGYTDE
jgi:arylsulfatase A-like enzyme